MWSCQRVEETEERGIDGDTNNSRYTRICAQKSGNEIGRIGNQKKNRDHSNHNIINVKTLPKD